MKCPVCHHITFDRIAATPETDAYLHCKNCYCIFLKGLVTETYDKNYLEYAKYDEKFHEIYARSFSYFHQSFLYNLGKTGSFLEIGFANPGVLLKAQEMGWQCTGLDLQISEEIREHKNITFIEGDIKNINHLITKKFDLIWMSHVVEHLTTQDIITALKDIKNILNSGGLLYIASPDASLYNTQYASLFLAHCKPTEHQVLYTMNAFQDLCKQCGYVKLFHDLYVGHNDENKYMTRAEWRLVMQNP